MSSRPDPDRGRTVPFLDLTREHTELEPELTAAFQRVLRSGRYILGPEVEAFEKECARYLGARHAVGVSSGTDALLVTLMALGIGPGDEVIVPAFGFVATASVVARLGATPIFADVLPCCFNVDPAAVEVAITERTRCVLPVHLFGQCAHMDPLLALCSRRGLPVVEDAAQAMGAIYRGKRAGTIGLAGCFSFFPSKNLGGLGDGGLVCTNDDRLAERLQLLRVQGARRPHDHELIGGNFRLDALQAALLRVKLGRLEATLARRRAIATLYRQGLAGAEGIRCPIECDSGHTYNQFVIRLDSAEVRGRLRARLERAGVSTAVYYPTPLALQPCFPETRASDYREAAAAAKQALALPIFAELTGSEVERVCAASSAAATVR